MSRNPTWNDTEDGALKAMASQYSASVIAQYLGRTVNGVRRRAQRLGIPLMKRGEHHHLAKYSGEIINQVRTLSDQGVKPKKIAMLTGFPFNRTIYNVIYFANRVNG